MSNLVKWYIPAAFLGLIRLVRILVALDAAAQDNGEYDDKEYQSHSPTHSNNDDCGSVNWFRGLNRSNKLKRVLSSNESFTTNRYLQTDQTDTRYKDIIVNSS